MKKFEYPGKMLSKEEQKLISGGGQDGCLALNAACNDHVQCCSNYCYSCPEGSCPPNW